MNNSDIFTGDFIYSEDTSNVLKYQEFVKIKMI